MIANASVSVVELTVTAQDHGHAMSAALAQYCPDAVGLAQAAFPLMATL